MRTKDQIDADRAAVMHHVAEHADDDGFAASEKWMNLDDLKALTKQNKLVRDIREVNDGNLMRRRSFFRLASATSGNSDVAPAPNFSVGATKMYAVADMNPKTRLYQVTVRAADALQGKSSVFTAGLPNRKTAVAAMQQHGLVHVRNFSEAKQLEAAVTSVAKAS